MRFPELREMFFSLSRQGILAAERVRQAPKNRTGARFSFVMIVGCALVGIGVSLFVRAGLGLPPFDVMHSALAQMLNLSLGQAGWVFAASIFAVAFLLGKRPTVDGAIFVLTVGFSVDLATEALHDADGLGLAVVYVAGGIATIAAGLALLLHAGMTGGPMELLMIAVAERGRDQYKFRIAGELAIVAGGFLLGGDAGVATIIFALTVGPLMRIYLQAMADYETGRGSRLERGDPSLSQASPLGNDPSAGVAREKVDQL